jgi:hypothetical protein
VWATIVNYVASGVDPRSWRAKSATAGKDLASGAACHRSSRERIERRLRSPQNGFPDRLTFQWYPIFGHYAAALELNGLSLPGKSPWRKTKGF